MSKNIKVLLGMTSLMVFFALGFLTANLYNHFSAPEIQQKPVVDIKEKRELVNEETQIIYEQEFLNCQHIIVSEFKDREILEGKTIDQLKKIYTSSNGYSIELIDDVLVIHQDIEDWCPEDKNTFRLKEYQGRVAVYKGPTSENDILEKVTSIYMDSLPADLQEKIRQGKWEFKDNQGVNDALESLDDYL